MQQMLIFAGTVLLVLAGGLSLIIRQSIHGREPFTPVIRRTYVRFRLSTRTQRLLRKAANAASHSQSTAVFQAYGRELLQDLHQLRQRVKRAPRLPAGSAELFCLMKLAETAVQQGVFSADALAEILASDHGYSLSSTGISIFPMCTAVVQAERLSDALEGFIRIQNHPDNSTELESKIEQPVHFAEELRQAVECFGAMLRMNWLIRVETADEIHHLLLTDPSGVYPRMTEDARLTLRIQAEAFARHAGISAADVVNRALILSQEAAEKSLEAHVGYWLQDAGGMQQLHKALQTRKGWLYARFAARKELCRYAILWALGAVGGFLFLQAGHPVFMLPFFAICAGNILRQFVKVFPLRQLPAVELSEISDDLRTLVVLPAVLRDPHEAITVVRRLKTARQAFPQEGVDFLLLGDFSDHLTSVSSQDAAIIHAAYTAVSALEDAGRFIYLQRSRTWDDRKHIYHARGGSQGAVREVCRLIAQGECEDLIAFSSVQAAHFERRYAYVLVLPEDGMPAPGILEKLLSVMAHPLNQRYPTADGWRGYAVLSPEGCGTYQGFGLLRPDAFLEATDGIVDPRLQADMLCGELAGHASIEGAHMDSIKVSDQWEEFYRYTKETWLLFTWQLPWVKTPEGIVRNPLQFFNRFHLREKLRNTLVPLAQCLILLWAVLTESWPLFLLALVAHVPFSLSLRSTGLLQLICDLSLLPTRATVNVRAAISLVSSRDTKVLSWPNLEIWAQGIAATILTALGIALPGMAIPAFVLAILFACFPLAHRLQGRPLHSFPGLTDEQLTLLEHTAASTWKYFEALSADTTMPLPPSSFQYDPALGTAKSTTPKSIGAFLLASVCAKDLGLIDASKAAEAINRTVSALQTLPMPFGLPCHRYSLPELTILDSYTNTAETGFLLCALLVSAQALRTWLPELTSEYEDLSGTVQAVANAFDLTRLYNQEAGLFHTGLDEAGQGMGYVSSFMDEALLLSIAARARRDIPPEHFRQLDFTCAKVDGQVIPLSRTGGAEMLLPELFIPVEHHMQHTFIRMMKKGGKNGIWGSGECCYFGFDEELQYRRGQFGLRDAALYVPNDAPVYAPYAAALALPYIPHEAAAALAHYQALGALGPKGFCESVDCTQATTLVGLHDTFHQGLILMSAAHVLADAPVQRYFCALPEIEACLPLLKQHQPAMIIQPISLKAQVLKEVLPTEYSPDPMVEPVASHRLGTEQFYMITDARGCSRIFDSNIPLTRYAAGALHGIQFYLTDEGRSYRLGDPFLPGHTIFAPGEVRFERICGSLKAELVCTVDTIRRRTIHILQVTNLSTLDRIIEAADFFMPDLGVPCDTLQPASFKKGSLILHARCTGQTLFHTMDCSALPLSSCACTDAQHFLGRNGTLHQPDGLTALPEDHVFPSAAPCMSFQVKFSLGGRGQVTLWFTTSLEDNDPPRLTELDGFRRLAALQHAALVKKLPSASHTECEALLSLPAQLWKTPIPAKTPDMDLNYTSRYGGFDPQTDDYVVLLPPGRNTPSPWKNTHHTRHYQETVSESGFKGPFKEEVWIRMEDDVLLTPWSPSLPRSIRMEAGATIWDAWSDKLDVRLCACCLPWHRFGMRVLRIRNASDSPLSLRIYVKATLAEPAAELALLPGGMMFSVDTQGLHRCIGGSGWTARRLPDTNVFSSLPFLDLPDEERGTVALLECSLQLQPHSSGESLWISGLARHSEDYARALLALEQGASAILRSVKADWARRISRITCSTPDDTFDLLMNRLLPAQALSAENESSVYAAVYLDPTAAKQTLLRAAMHAQTREDWIQLALATADYVEISDDPEVLDVHMRHRDASLFDCCASELLGTPLDRNGLPLGEPPAIRCMKYALAAKRLNVIRPRDDLAEFSRKLLLAADAHLWKDGCYGEPLELSVQCLACEAFGSTPRTRQAIMTAWSALYDRPHGLIRSHESLDIPPLPGLPENGGMDTAQAALCIRALIRTGHMEQAYELLLALNPLHHTDTPERLEAFCGAPYLLHGGMYAAPMEAGRAVPERGAQAASMLYGVVLRDILGVHRCGDVIRMQPVVPPEWEKYTVTIQKGTSTWYITMERHNKALTLDVDEVDGCSFTIVDDGRIHQVHIPL